MQHIQILQNILELEPFLVSKIFTPQNKFTGGSYVLYITTGVPTHDSALSLPLPTTRKYMVSY